jgi:hypothetical protein
MNSRLVTSLRAVALLAVCLTAAPTGAQPTREKILQDLHIEGEGPCAIIHVGFSFPVRYQRHFPLDSGKEMRVQLKPIAVSTQDRKALPTREAISPHKFDDRVPLNEVIYEGDVSDGPYLTFFFTREVSFKVGQGRDFRSIRVALPGPDSTGNCSPEPDEGK